MALRRMKSDSRGSTAEDDVGLEKFDWHWVKMALVSPNTWFCSLAWFFLLIPLYVSLCVRIAYTRLTRCQSFSLFLPTIIKSLGYTSTVAQAFTAPPNLASFVFVLITAASSDKVKARGFFMIGGCLLAIIGYAMLIGASAASTKYGGTFFVAVGVYLGSPMVRSHGSFLSNLANRSEGHGLVVEQFITSLRASHSYWISDCYCQLCCVRRHFYLSHQRCVSNDTLAAYSADET